MVDTVGSVQSVERALKTLELLSDYEGGIGLLDAAKKLGLNKSTLHRMLATLTDLGYVKQDSNSNKYALSLRMFEIGSKKIERLTVVDVAKPFIKQLMEQTNEVVHLVIRDNLDIMYLSKVEPQKSLKMYTRIGMRKPLYCTAMGKAILSFADEDEIEQVWSQSQIVKHTENTITELPKFKAALQRYRRQNYALDDQEVELGVKCFGTVIRDYSGHICAAISLSTYSFTLTPEIETNYIQQLLACAALISKELGYYTDQ